MCTLPFFSSFFPAFVFSRPHDRRVFFLIDCFSNVRAVRVVGGLAGSCCGGFFLLLSRPMFPPSQSSLFSLCYC